MHPGLEHSKLPKKHKKLGRNTKKKEEIQTFLKEIIFLNKSKENQEEIKKIAMSDCHLRYGAGASRRRIFKAASIY